MVLNMSWIERRRSETSKTSGFKVCRRAKARSWLVSLEARVTVSLMASV
jgi:hypothetical protein